MSRLPTPGGDDGTWGDTLNDFLMQSHNPDGTLKSGVVQSGTPAGGDLGGTYPNPTVDTISGVAVSGTPSSGQVLTATSGAAASWAAPGSPFNQDVSVVKAFAFNTPGLTTTGLFMISLQAGDVISYISFSVVTAFDGTTPTLHLGTAAFPDAVGTGSGTDVSNGDQPSDDPNIFFNVAGDVSQIVVHSAVDVYAKLDDGAGSNPGSTQGNGWIGIIVYRVTP